MTSFSFFKPTFPGAISKMAFFYTLAWILSGILFFPALAQEKQMFQIKTFDENIKPYPDISIAINGMEYIDMGSKGVAFVELSSDALPIRSIVVKNETLEAASWNNSRGIIEVIIRKKSYQLVPVIVRGAEANGLTIEYSGIKEVKARTDARGMTELPLGLDEKITSRSQFKIEGYQIRELKHENGVITLFAQKINPVAPAVAENETQEETIADTDTDNSNYFRDFDLSKLDSIQSLTVFYAIFKNYQIEDLDPSVKQMVDAKFTELVGQLQDSISRNALTFIENISDTSLVAEDVHNLLSQARMESQMLMMQQSDFEEKIEVINEKLSAGFENMDESARESLLADLTMLERILTENESKFYRNQSRYQQIINGLKETFFNLEDLETKLSVSEAQRREEQRLFRERLFAALAIITFLGILTVILIHFSNKLKKQKEMLSEANAEITRMNTNLEHIVAERTKMLLATNKELDTVLYRASHDLRSPIRSILGLCNIAGTLSGGESKELLSRVVQTTHDMDKLLKKLSVISEINQPDDFEPIVLADLIRDIRKDFEPMVKDYKIKFVVNCPEDITIFTSLNLLEVIISNLIDNALFFSIIKNPENARVELNASVNDGKLTLSILDNGVGVESDVSQKMYEMFYRGNENSKGHGLGLYIVQKSVYALNGTIDMESKAGEFTRFTIQLPARKAENIEEMREIEATA